MHPLPAHRRPPPACPRLRAARAAAHAAMRPPIHRRRRLPAPAAAVPAGGARGALLAAVLVLGCAGAAMPAGEAAAADAGTGGVEGFDGLTPAPDAPAPPPFRLDALDGGPPLGPASLRGRVVLINFWATWCAPCLHELPAIERLWRSLGDEGLAVVAVNAGESGGDVRYYLERFGLALSFPIALDPGLAAFRAFGVRSLPATFVLGRKGRVRYFAEGARPMDSPRIRALFEALLAEPPDGG